MDLVPAGNWVANILSGEWSQSLSGFVAAYAPWLALLAFLIALALSGFGRRVRAVIAELFFTNWQLMLLGSAALVLSLAGGWTTWDGMRNFTGEPVLSLMFTFGIHGVMLIVAWLIGESFATGMSSVPQRGYARVTAPLVVIAALAGMLLLIALAAYHLRYGISADWAMHISAVAGAVMLAFVLLAAFSRSDVVAPYTQALRIVARNSMLWVMFLACMSTSVFFSFDSRFNVVFPQDERKRVADLRAQNQVIGILADIEATTTNRRLEQSRQLFESDGWRAYEPHLINLANASQNSQRDIERYFVQQMEDRRRGIAEQQERITTAQSGQVGLAGKKLSIAEEVTRLKGERPGLAGEYAQLKSELDAKRREVDAKRVEALAEDRGVEGTGKVGKGQIYRQRMSELRFLEDEYEIKGQRTKDAQKRLNAVETRIAQIERELTGIDGEIAKMKGEAQTAEHRIKAVQEAGAAVDGPKVDPARALLAFETARGEFRQAPTVEHLTQVQQLCGQLHGAMSSTPATKDKVRSIECDPKQASEAASALFALNAGSKTFQAHCAGGDKLAAYTHADELFGFARKCLADSGLPSKDTDALRTKISFTELTRDDRAHRFVVSWNAFSDGNRLAYLALAIAIGIDSLIFMTGLFGANAVRSPLSDVPSSKPRNAQQLEAVIETALLPHPYENARLIMNAMRPMTPRDGYSQCVVIHDHDPHAADLHRILNAAAVIGAVRQVEHNVYELRSELFEYLSTAAKKAFEADKQHVVLAEMERIVSVALSPNIGRNVETVLQYVNPIEENPTLLEKLGLKGSHGFTAEIKLDEVAEDHKRVVRGTLNAGATVAAVQRANATHYFINRDLYKTLARIRAGFMQSSGYASQEITRAPYARRLTVVQNPQIAHKRINDSLRADATRSNGDGAAGLSSEGGRVENLDQSPRQMNIPPVVMEVFANELGVSEEFLSDLVASPHQALEKQIAAIMMELSENDVLIQRELASLLGGKRAAVSAAQRKVKESDATNSSIAQPLGDYLAGIVHLLLLSEGGDYEWALPRLIEQAHLMNDAAFPGGQRDKWIAIIQEHYEGLRRLPRSQEQDWQRVIILLNKLRDQLNMLRASAGNEPHLPRHMLS